ncbi:glyoxalase superfamily protein [Maricaulaceae bacterium MS644]
MTHDLKALKEQAKRLRAALADDGDFVSHSESLELIARQHGYRDWNTLHASAGNRAPEPFALGATIRGRYLGQSFTAEIRAVRKLADGARYELTLDLEEAVDVVTFDSFSNFRKRVSGLVNAQGLSDARTSDGRPHFELAV